MEPLRPLSNSLEDFVAGGLYPGGTGIIREFRYRLWDYAGTQPPDSNVAVYCRFTPKDGSNEDKDVEHYWNVGPSDELAPDHSGGFLLPVQKPGKEPRKGISGQCNWAQALKGFINCGLNDKPSPFNVEPGIRMMEGSEVTFARVDQVERDFQREDQVAVPGQAPSGQQRGRRKNQTLVPTRAKFAWERGPVAGAGATASAATGKAAAVAAARARAQAQVAAAEPVAAPVAPAPATAQVVPINGNGGAATATGNALADALAAILAEPPYNENGIPFAEIAKLATERMTLMNVSGKARALALKSVVNETALVDFVTAQGWAYEGGTLFDSLG